MHVVASSKKSKCHGGIRTKPLRLVGHGRQEPVPLLVVPLVRAARCSGLQVEECKAELQVKCLCFFLLSEGTKVAATLADPGRKTSTRDASRTAPFLVPKVFEGLNSTWKQTGTCGGRFCSVQGSAWGVTKAVHAPPTVFDDLLTPLDENGMAFDVQN